MSWYRHLILAGAVALGLPACAPTGSTATAGESSRTPTPAITVAAAADLRLAFEELGRAFEAQSDTEVTFSFGSSGQLAQQIRNGAPFDVFASANVELVDDVIAAGKADRSTKSTYAFGRIVVYTAEPGGPTTLDGLAAPGVQRVAIPNPEHAPYGVAAEDALRAAGVNERVAPKLVLGENVSDTLRLATSGNADAAIVALSLVITRQDGTWALVDPALHRPLEQALVVTSTDPARAELARRFAAFVGSPAGREVMSRYGFVLPGEQAR